MHCTCIIYCTSNKIYVYECVCLWLGFEERSENLVNLNVEKYQMPFSDCSAFYCFGIIFFSQGLMIKVFGSGEVIDAI